MNTTWDPMELCEAMSGNQEGSKHFDLRNKGDD